MDDLSPLDFTDIYKKNLEEYLKEQKKLEEYLKEQEKEDELEVKEK